MLKLRNEVLFKIQLRRTKAAVGKEINLPPLTVKIVKIQMRDDERDFYEGIYKQQKLKYDSFAEKGTVLNNYAHIFELLGRMRQVCRLSVCIDSEKWVPNDAIRCVVDVLLHCWAA